MTQERTTGTVVCLIMGMLLMMGGCGSEESSPPGGTGQVILKPPPAAFTAAALPEQTATLDIEGTPLTGIRATTVNSDGSVVFKDLQVPVGTWTFRITYEASHTTGGASVVVAKASGVGTVEANKFNQVDLPWANTNFFSDNDAATNLEEVIAGTDPRNSDDWPLICVALSAGLDHSLVLKKKDDKRSNDTTWAWGGNGSGKLGNLFAEIKQLTPVEVGESQGVTSFSGMVAVSAGHTHSLALKRIDTEVTVWAWGGDVFGQLGDDVSLANQPTPVQVAGLTGVRALSAGGSHSLALKGDGTVWAWGRDVAGQLGNDVPLANQPTPVQVAGLTGVRALSAGNFHSLALKGDGTVWAWGTNAAGQLGNDVPLVNQPTPVQVKGAGGSGFLTDVVAVSAGHTHSLALKDDGTVWAWGSDAAGQLGDDVSLANQPTPVQVAGLTGVRALSAGNSFSLALKGDGTVWAWGSGGSGQLGNNQQVNQPTPVQVKGVEGSGFLTDVVAISAGASHSLALKRIDTEVTVWAWGSGGSGQLGNDLQVNKPTPVQVDTTRLGPVDMTNLGPCK